MTDQPNNEQTDTRQPDPVPAPPAGALSTDITGQEHMIPKSRFDEVNTELKSVRAALAKLQKADEERQEAEAIAKGDHEQLIAKLRPQADRAKALEATLTEYLTAELAGIPDELQALVPNVDITEKLRWVKEARQRGLFANRPAPGTDAGARGDNAARPVQLTPLERQIAHAAGMSEAEYAKYKAQGQQQDTGDTLPDILR